jgi:hypothetical protein
VVARVTLKDAHPGIHPMTEPPAPNTRDRTAALWAASLRLVLWLAALYMLVLPLIRELPLGQTTRTSLLAWLLVAVAFYWLYAGMGVRPLLLLQLFLFSTAAALLTAKLVLVGIGVLRLSLLRRVARVLIMLGAASAIVNLIAMLMTALRTSPPPSDGRES